MRSEPGADSGYRFGTFKGVFTPSILTILGVILYLRMGWVLGHVGLAATLAIITLSSSVTFITGLSVSALATNMRVRGGGAYYMLSRSLGVEAGAAVGIPLFLAQAISIAFYIAGFSEAVVALAPALDPRWVGLATLVGLGLLATFSADFTLRTQYGVMVLVVLSLASIFAGAAPESAAGVQTLPRLGFWPVLAVYFPAVTGILAGVSLSGELARPSRALPLGTLAAVGVSYLIYLALALFINHLSIASDVLIGDTMLIQKLARVGLFVLLGLWAASLSSAVGCLLSAPRTLQALANDRVVPLLLGKPYGRFREPRLASALTVGIAAAGVYWGSLDVIAPVLTMFYLTTYGLLNLSAGLEELMANPSWRPTFRVPAVVALAGFGACVAIMLMINAGAALVAFGCVLAVYWIMERRAMRARWGDMRLGVVMFALRKGLHRLAAQPLGGRNWRPNLLVLSGAPSRRWHLIEVAHAISRNRSLMTVASIIPEANWTADRAESLRKSMLVYLEKARVEAHVRIQPGEDHWAGIRDLIRAYGFGPLVPNTILLGAPAKADSGAPLARLTRLIAASHRNLLIVKDEGGEADDEAPVPTRLDVWWRGRPRNVAFMLAVACMIRRRSGRRADLRLCRIVEREEDVGESRRELASFLNQARVDAEVHVLVLQAEAPFDRIVRESSDARYVFLGLRLPGGDEADDAYAAYYRQMLAALDPLPTTVLAMAAESVDFQSLFSKEA